MFCNSDLVGKLEIMTMLKIDHLAAVIFDCLSEGTMLSAEYKAQVLVIQVRFIPNLPRQTY